MAASRCVLDRSEAQEPRSSQERQRAVFKRCPRADRSRAEQTCVSRSMFLLPLPSLLPRTPNPSRLTAPPQRTPSSGSRRSSHIGACHELAGTSLNANGILSLFVHVLKCFRFSISLLASMKRRMLEPHRSPRQPLRLITPIQFALLNVQPFGPSGPFTSAVYPENITDTDG